jgi:hypothetical protein
MSLAEEAERIDGRRVVNHLYDCAMFRAGTLPTRPRDADRFPGVSGR